MRAAVVIAVLHLGSVVHAEPEHASITSGISLDAGGLVNAALTLDGSYRLGWLAVRGIVSRGVATTLADTDGGSGPLRRYVAGLEARLCSAGTTDLASGGSHTACAYLGLDAGYETAHAAFRVPPSYDAHGPIATTRLGMYGVYHRFVMRSAFVVFVHEDQMSYADTSLTRGWGLGVEVSAGYRF
jgi:hypothetical protein